MICPECRMIVESIGHMPGCSMAPVDSEVITLNGPDDAKTAGAIADEIIEVCQLSVGCRGTIASAIRQARVDGARFAMSDLTVGKDIQDAIVANIEAKSAVLR